MARKRIGELLLEHRAVTPKQLEEGLAHHRATRQRLGVALVQKGYLTEEKLCQVLSESLGIPTVNLAQVSADPKARAALRARFCESNDLFPFALEERPGRKQLLVAMSDPLNQAAIEEMEFTTEHKVVPRLAPLTAIRQAIVRHYHPSQQASPSQGSGALRTPIELPSSSPDDEVLEGIPLGDDEPADTSRTALAELIRARELARKDKRAHPSGAQSVAAELDLLFGGGGEAREFEALEHKFWAMMRIMAKKGLITREEFLSELDEE